jgi:hypothetical protein
MKKLSIHIGHGYFIPDMGNRERKRERERERKREMSAFYFYVFTFCQQKYIISVLSSDHMQKLEP